MLMKEKRCQGYNKNTETTRIEIGTANGEVLYKETEIILSESCSVFNKVDDFDCSKCPLKEGLLNDK